MENHIPLLEQRNINNNSILIVVDGAAFGSEIRDTYQYLNSHNKCVLYAPESFEWLLLKSNGIPGVSIRDILENPENYIDSKEYISWERYFTKLLTDITAKNKIWRYTKKKLPQVYTSVKVLNAVKRIMQLIYW